MSNSQTPAPAITLEEIRETCLLVASLQQPAGTECMARCLVALAAHVQQTQAAVADLSQQLAELRERVETLHQKYLWSMFESRTEGGFEMPKQQTPGADSPRERVETPRCPRCGREAIFCPHDYGDSVTPPIDEHWYCKTCGISFSKWQQTPGADSILQTVDPSWADDKPTSTPAPLPAPDKSGEWVRVESQGAVWAVVLNAPGLDGYQVETFWPSDHMEAVQKANLLNQYISSIVSEREGKAWNEAIEAAWNKTTQLPASGKDGVVQIIRKTALDALRSLKKESK